MEFNKLVVKLLSRENAQIYQGNIGKKTHTKYENTLWRITIKNM